MVGDYLTRARLSGVSWPTLLDDEALERVLYPPRPAVPSAERGEPDWAEVHRELKRKGVTLFLLWEEYKSPHPNGFSVLSTLPSLRWQARPGDATNPSRRGDTVCRLCWTNSAGGQSRYRGTTRGINLAISGTRNESSSISTCVERVARRFRLHGTCRGSAQGCRGLPRSNRSCQRMVGDV